MSNSPQPLHAEKHPKQDFQVERIAFFSDAVFAIAITLLVLELRPPVITKDTTASELWPVIKELKWKFASLLFSFALIVNYWMRHHNLFKHIHNYNRQIIIANMLLLLPIIFFPFTTSFLYENMASDNDLLVVPYRFFMLNNALAGFTTYYFYWTVMKRYKGMSTPMPREEAQEFERRLNVLTICFMLIFLISFISFKYSFLGIIPIAVLNMYKRVTAKRTTLTKQHTHAEPDPSPADQGHH